MKDEQNLLEELAVSITRFLQKQLRNFKRRLIKSYSRLMDQYERK